MMTAAFASISGTRAAHAESVTIQTIHQQHLIVQRETSLLGQMIEEYGRQVPENWICSIKERALYGSVFGKTFIARATTRLETEAKVSVECRDKKTYGYVCQDDTLRCQIER